MRCVTVMGVLVGCTIAAASCDNAIDRDAQPRYYVPPDASEPQSNNQKDASEPVDSDGGTDASLSDAIADAPSDAPVSNFNPATLALTAWWRAPFAAAAWVGTPSQGSSATRNLAEATNPPALGTAVNNQIPADFDGTNDILTNPSPIGTLLSATAWSAVALVYVDAVTTTTSAGLLELLSDTGGYWNIGTWNNPTPKVVVGQFDGAQKAVEVPITLNAWNLVQAKFDGTMLRLRVNGGVWTLATANAIQITTGTLNVGSNYLKSLFFNGKALEIMLAATAFPDATFEEIRGYAAARYVLQL